MARPNPKTKQAELETEIEAVEAPAPEAEAPKAKAVTVYSVNPDMFDEETGEKKPVKSSSVGGVILEIISERGRASKAEILEDFRTSEAASKIKAKQWFDKPQEYVNGYVDWLKGNRSVVSEKVEA